ncbi:YHS domain-containing (seleno)protein [Paracoccus tegillarcae]|nr:YHS domain-containing (seleno)protein [Paracoccus tegillarcae]
MKPMLKGALAALAISVALPAASWAAGFDVNATTTDLALRGYDPVSYFTESTPMAGEVDITAQHNGATYRFASVENKEMFEADPAKFAPQYGGYCAFGLAQGYKFDGDPEVWKIVDDKLYLNLSPKVSEIWQQDVPGNIDMADDKWMNVKDVAPAELAPH